MRRRRVRRAGAAAGCAGAEVTGGVGGEVEVPAPGAPAEVGPQRAGTQRLQLPGRGLGRLARRVDDLAVGARALPQRAPGRPARPGSARRRSGRTAALVRPGVPAQDGAPGRASCDPPRCTGTGRRPGGRAGAGPCATSSRSSSVLASSCLQIARPPACCYPSASGIPPSCLLRRLSRIALWSAVVDNSRDARAPRRRGAVGAGPSLSGHESRSIGRDPCCTCTGPSGPTRWPRPWPSCSPTRWRTRSPPRSSRCRPKGVERWLAQRLSHRLGRRAGRGDGVCAGVAFPSPAALVGDALVAAAAGTTATTTRGSRRGWSGRCWR